MGKQNVQEEKRGAEFSELISYIMEVKGIDCSEFSKANLSPGTVRNIMNGSRSHNPSLDTAVEISRVLQVEPASMVAALYALPRQQNATQINRLKVISRYLRDNSLTSEAELAGIDQAVSTLEALVNSAAAVSRKTLLNGVATKYGLIPE